jgi:hypothetical protein
MTFLAPLFLAGLAAVAVPIVVHLTNRPKREAYAFPSLMFLQQIPFRSVRRQRIRHWWLLAIRAAVVALVASAFARPLLERWAGIASALTTGQDVVVLLDNSYSMRHGDRWQRAVAAARNAVSELGPEDRASAALFGAAAVSLGQPATDRTALLEALASAEPGFGATRYTAGLQLARDLLEQSTLPRRRLVLVSDFQRAGWRPEEAVRMPAGTAVDVVNVGGDAANLALTGLAMERSVRGQREEVTLSARVANLGRAARRGVRVTLEVDGHAVQTRTVNLEAGALGAAVFAPLPLSDRPVRVIARADRDQLPVDDAQYAVVAPGDVVRVLFLAPGGAGRQAAFLRQALQVTGSPRFDVASGTQLTGYQVAILADVPPGSAALAARLSDFARRGGGVLVVLGEQAGGTWGPAWRELLGGVPGGTAESEAMRGTALAGLRYDHPVFQPFQAPKSGDFGATRVYRYRRFTPDSGAVVLAHYEDGAAALVEHRVGRGRVLVWTSGLDNVWSDLPVQPVFLPLVHQMMRYLAGYVEHQTAFPVGFVLDLDAARGLVGGGRDVSVESPAGRRVALGAGGEPAIRLDAPGFYAVRAVGEDVAAASVAVNPDPAEGDLAPMDLDAFLAAVRPAEAAPAAAPSGEAVISPAERERRQGLWWYLVAGAVVLALAETLLSNRLPAIGRAGA